jgi:DNA-binding NarL/FixJ family response regulator
MTSVVLADDQDVVRSGLRALLQARGIDVVGEAEHGRAAIEATRAHQPDVLLMDIRMPVMDGVEATRQQAALHPESVPRILVQTTFDADEHVVHAIRAGASGFLLKDVAPTDFVKAIRTVAAGEALIAPSVTRRLLDRFARLPIPADEAYADRLRDLTDRERDVLKLVAQGMSNREIADHLSLAEPTVKTHVSHLLIKLELRDRAQLVALAYEVGVIRPGSGSV